jgi:hypothetical protein
MPSRRDLLKSSLGIAAGAVGLGAAGRALRHGSPAAATPGSKPPASLTILGRNWHVTTEGREPGDRPAAGDRTNVSGELVDAGGRKVGEFFGSATHVDSPFEQGPPAGMTLQTHTFRLADGTIHGTGTVSQEDGDTVFAVVGGTGRYHGIRGSYVARQQPIEHGGDGSAVFTLTLTT